MGRIVCLFIACGLALSLQGSVVAAESPLFSPDGAVRVDFTLVNGRPEVALSYAGRTVGRMTLGPEYTRCGHGRYEVLKVAERRVESSWKPVWGFRAEYPDNYTERRVELSLPGKGEASMTVVLRAYDEGFAARYELPLETYGLDEIRRERVDFTFPVGAVAWPIPSTEATYPAEPQAIKDLSRSAEWRMPFTLRTPDGVYASILEAGTVKWPRSYLKADGEGGLKSVYAIGTKTGREYAVSPWRAVLLAESAGGLVERAYLVENLNEPNRVKDAADWIRPGLTVRDFGRLDNASLLSDARIVKEAMGVRYLQLDWGWYGTERPWTDSERDAYRAKRPDLEDGDWVANTYADPHRPARGYVPYHPFWERFLAFGRRNVDLDIPSLARELRAMDMGLCLYLHGIVLEANDMEELFALYERWGVAGLKPGFVSYGSQQATDYLRRMADCAARHHLWLDIHDEHIPDGFERTWPNVMITEGGGGEEGRHPLRQDCALPFARCLAGPFDYTPRFFDANRSKAHAAAMLVVYPGPTAVVRTQDGGAEAVKRLCSDAPDAMAFVKSLPMTYDETRVPVAEIAKKVAVARRRGATWYVGGLAGEGAETVVLPLDFLEEGRDYALTLVVDDGMAERSTVRNGQSVTVDLRAGGGFVATLDLRDELRQPGAVVDRHPAASASLEDRIASEHEVLVSDQWGGGASHHLRLQWAAGVDRRADETGARASLDMDDAVDGCVPESHGCARSSAHGIPPCPSGGVRYTGGRERTQGPRRFPGLSREDAPFCAKGQPHRHELGRLLLRPLRQCVSGKRGEDVSRCTASQF